ncbi:hypothetical protein X926_08910 [Petrotoga sp. HWHPT.55.6.3]|nr:hypothetical protein X926_08910 [Petrotoga sp. HWHPT.55.6.3]
MQLFKKIIPMIDKRKVEKVSINVFAIPTSEIGKSN